MEIMLWDPAKLASVPLQDDTLRDKFYTPDEQLDRCVAQLFGAPLPTLPAMLPSDAAAYENAFKGCMLDHPFLDGGRASSAVFGAMISVQALRRTDAADAAVRHEPPGMVYLEAGKFDGLG